MKPLNGSNNNRSFGKITAVVMILLFIAINHFRSQKDIIPKNKITRKVMSTRNQNSRNQISNQIDKKHLERLKYAYTGKWAKNEIKDETNGEHSFSTPVNTRNAVAPTSKKLDKAKKKKVANKKTKKKVKVAKRSKKAFQNDYDFDHLSGNTNTPYGTGGYYNQLANQQNTQNRTPSDDDKEKRLSAQEWLELIAKSNGVEEFVSAFRSGKVDLNLFYSVSESLLSSSSENSKKLGFQALSQFPSGMSFTKVAHHLNDEMSKELKTFAEGTLAAYEKPEQLRVLNPVLNGADSNARILAATIIKSVTTSIIQAQASSGENVVYTEAQLKLYNTLLSQSLSLINAALEAGVDATVAASFTSTRTILVQFLS